MDRSARYNEHPIQTIAAALVLVPIATTLLLFSLSNLDVMTPTSTFYARSLAAYLTLSLCAIYGVLASLVLRLAGQHRLSQWATARSFKWTMRYTCDVRFEIIRGAEYLTAERPAVLIGNHQSALDILLLGTIWPYYCSVTAKSSLRWMPFLGWFMALSGTVFIDRADRASATRALDGAAKEMRDARQSVFMFPEGTRTNAATPVLRDFKKGAFHLAVAAQVPILPVVAANYHGVLSIKERRFRSGRIPVVVLPPISTKGLEAGDVDRLVKETRERMLAELVSLSESPRGLKAMLPDPAHTTTQGQVGGKIAMSNGAATASGLER